MNVRQMKNVDWMGVRSATEERVKEQIASLFRHKLGPGSLPEYDSKETPSIIGLISPHAGYVYSGPVAAHGYYRLGRERQKAQLIIVAGPNHRWGAPIALPPHDAWETPLGQVPIATDLVRSIDEARKSLEKPLRSYIQVNHDAHAGEWSIELQLPFLQMVLEEFTFLPIGIEGSGSSAPGSIPDAQIDAFAGLVTKILDEAGIDDVVVIASSDFTHGNSYPQLDHDTVTKMDQHAVDEILKFGKAPVKLREVIIRENLSLCGYQPIRFLLDLASKMGATKAECLKYATSGDTSGMRSGVVGYGSFCLKK
ncbi:MAG: AmmeMemoRadiSam system protein B [Candidatus Thorarchaeota archaeon]